MLSIIVNESKKIFFCVFKYSEQTNIYFLFIDQILIYKKNILKNPDIIPIYLKALVFKKPCSTPDPPWNINHDPPWKVSHFQGGS